MRPINIQSLLSTYKLVETNKKQPEVLDKYLTYLYGFSKSPLKDHEWKTLKSFAEYIRVQLDSFYLNYSIPQIAKEFDLLYLGEKNETKYIINIELKSNSTEEKIKKQLLRNYYYLKFTQRKLLLFSFDESKNILYQLKGQELETKDSLVILQNILSSLTTDINTDLDSLFNPSNYLISPFNTTEEFLKQEYFLNRKQEQIKKSIMKFITAPEGCFASITGAAGTGKTLLTYDIAMTLKKQKKKVLVLHCAQLNWGQHTLVEEGWDIRSTQEIISIKTEEYDLIIIDEAQRLKDDQWETIQKLSNKCIFSFDEKQYLSPKEKREQFNQKIKNLTGNNYHKLTEKVRTNKEIADFIKQLLNKNRPKSTDSKERFQNIEVYYFSTSNDLSEFLSIKAKTGWVIPQYTPAKSSARSFFYYEKYFKDLPNYSAHSVIGQEYDNVVAVIDEKFFYDEKSNLLCAKNMNSYQTYSLERMFYQIVTRTRKKLCIAILNNEAIFHKCLDIVN
ncbi:Uncharacterized conserved protein [Porphyromonas cangingivalis]|uniref:DNA/RNA helicase domain-containing protein n=1 Tax=Porphyromonas cangingivalis TaxID=36874 RepID=UPI000D896BC4|nr:DNA/RNA helicase domain-containing protein [Porphyromonas cangingivalis]SPY34252.1 Uncharacterized conserved protein [Porphyromonas cangingivalis]